MQYFWHQYVQIKVHYKSMTVQLFYVKAQCKADLNVIIQKKKMIIIQSMLAQDMYGLIYNLKIMRFQLKFH